MRRTLLATLVLLPATPLALPAQYQCVKMPDLPTRDTLVLGTVLEDSTLRPLPMVFVAVNHAPFGMTDCEGRYTLPVAAPGDTLSTMSDYFETGIRVIPAESGGRPTVDFRLRRLPPKPLPTDSLLGDWMLRLWRDGGGDRPVLEARLTVLPGEWTPLGTVEPVLHTGELAELMSGIGPWQPPDSLAATIFGDSVSIWLTPGVFDAGYTLMGVIQGDGVDGIWCGHNFAHECRPEGRATMSRH